MVAILLKMVWLVNIQMVSSLISKSSQRTIVSKITDIQISDKLHILTSPRIPRPDRANKA